VVCALASAQAVDLNTSVHIVARRHDSVRNLAPSANVAMHEISSVWPKCHFETHKLLEKICTGDGTVVHDHGIWNSQNYACTSYALRHKLPYVVSTHGMLRPWALAYKPLKKRVARWLYQDHLLNNASCIMAASEIELDGLRQAGFKNSIAVVPIGIDSSIPELPRTIPTSPRIVLCLSRIHPKKGLIHAIEAWNALRPKGWRLNIVGPSECKHREALEGIVNTYGLQNEITFFDPVYGVSKYQLFYDADFFLLPTYGENFGVVVAEALACKLPVLTTVGTPWKELIARRCGWFIDIGTAPLIEALEQVFKTEIAELKRMGERGHQWVVQEFQWQKISRQSIAVYDWLLQRGSKPDFVYRW